MEEQSGFITEPALDGIEEGLKLLHSSPDGFCELWRAQKFGQFVVLKSLKPQYREDPVYEALLRKEFEIGYVLNEPHICRTYHYRSLPELGNCIEMEWVDGKTLSERFPEGKKPDETLFRKIAAELCDAVAYLHSKQVIHRDIKPSNILLTDSGDNVKLIDFGMADSDDSALLKMQAGTRSCLAPEVLAGGNADTRTDIWAVGRTLSDLTDGHRKAIRKACSERPEARYRYVAELKRDLLKPSRRPWLYIVSALAVLLAGFMIFLKSHPDSPAPSPLPAADSVQVITPPEAAPDTSRPLMNPAPKAASDKEATREDIDALFKEATGLFE